MIRWYFGGIGSGKTAALVTEHLTLSLEFPGSLSIIGAPTYKMLENVDWREFLKFCPKELIAKVNRSDLSITLINGSEILFLAGDTEAHIDRFRGLTISHASFDEIQLFPEYILTVALGRLRQQNGARKIMCAGSPRGRGWIYTRLVEEAEKHKGTDTWIHTTTYDNVAIVGEEYIKSMESQYSGIFRQQELMGEFVGFEGLVYSGFSRHTHLFDGGEFKFKDVICGVDWGFSNPSVLLVIGLDTDGRAWLINELYERNVLIDDLIKIAKDFKDKYNIRQFIADPSEPQFIQMFRNAGLQTIEAKNDVIPGIVKVSSYIEKQKDGKPRLFVRKNCINTLMEFDNYRYPDKKLGKESDEKPLKIYDHAMDALRYALMSIQTEKPSYAIKGVRRI